MSLELRTKVCRRCGVNQGKFTKDMTKQFSICDECWGNPTKNESKTTEYRPIKDNEEARKKWDAYHEYAFKVWAKNRTPSRKVYFVHS